MFVYFTIIPTVETTQAAGQDDLLLETHNPSRPVNSASTTTTKAKEKNGLASFFKQYLSAYLITRLRIITFKL